MNTNPNIQSTDDLSEIERLLDSLSAADRAAVSPGFEARIAAATQPSVRASPSTQSPELRLVHAPTTRTVGATSRHTFTRSPARIAAALLVACSLIATFVATRSQNTPSPTPFATVASLQSSELERDVDQLLAVYAALDGEMVTEINALFDATSSLGESVTSGTPEADWVEGSL